MIRAGLMRLMYLRMISFMHPEYQEQMHAHGTSKLRTEIAGDGV